MVVSLNQVLLVAARSCSRRPTKGDGAEDVGKRSIPDTMVDDDGGVAGSIHGPGRISKQPWLS
jgi:hypothetical protein